MTDKKSPAKPVAELDTALTPGTLVAILSRAGANVTEAMVQADVEAGAPVNDDGTMNLVHYAAWLVQKA